LDDEFRHAIVAVPKPHIAVSYDWAFVFARLIPGEKAVWRVAIGHEEPVRRSVVQDRLNPVEPPTIDNRLPIEDKLDMAIDGTVGPLVSG